MPGLEKEKQVAVNSIISDKDGNLWIGTFGYGLYMKDVHTGKWNVFRSNGKEGSLKSDKIWKVYCDSDGIVWIATLEGGLSRFDIRHRKFKSFSFESGLCTDIYEIMEDSGGRFWIGTWDKGLFNMDRVNEVFTRAPIPADKCEAVRCIYEVSPGVLLIGGNSGLFGYDVKTCECMSVTLSSINNGTTVNDGIYSILTDREGGLWIGGYFAGLSYRHNILDTFKHHRLSENGDMSQGNVISRMVEDSQGNMWIATEDKGLAYFDRGNGKTSFIERNLLSHTNIHALLLDGQKLWIGSIDGCIDVYDTHSGKVEHYDYSRGLSVGSIYSLFRDMDGTIYVGGIFGLMTYDQSTDMFVRMENFPPGSYVYDMAQSSRGILWFATYGDGVFSYNPRTRQWKNYQHDSSDSCSIGSNKVICINTDDPDVVWLGTEGEECRDMTLIQILLSWSQNRRVFLIMWCMA